jgi:hypothetical protein
VLENTGFPPQFIPHLMRGGNDEKIQFLTFYECVNVGLKAQGAGENNKSLIMKYILSHVPYAYPLICYRIVDHFNGKSFEL